jgi:hypothetical protein
MSFQTLFISEVVFSLVGSPAHTPHVTTYCLHSLTAMSADLHLDCPLRYTDYQGLEKRCDWGPIKPEGYSHAGDFPGTQHRHSCDVLY